MSLVGNHISLVECSLGETLAPTMRLPESPQCLVLLFALLFRTFFGTCIVAFSGACYPHFMDN
jgi:hypothetical protein